MSVFTPSKAYAAPRCVRLATPTVGRYVRVVAGKHIGAGGTVTWYGRSSHAVRLPPAAIEGKHGYRVGICIKCGTDPIYVNAEHVEVVEI